MPPFIFYFRLFGELSQTPVHQYRMITETVVFTMLAERNLGPRLFGVFPGGRLEEFIPGHPLTTVEMRSQEFSEQIARLNIPVADLIFNLGSLIYPKLMLKLLLKKYPN